MQEMLQSMQRRSIFALERGNGLIAEIEDLFEVLVGHERLLPVVLWPHLPEQRN
jgi:hypothetical protein